MKKSLILAAVVTGTILLLALFLVMRQHAESPGRQFQVRDGEKIRQVVFRRDTITLTLRKKKGVWRVNGRWKVRPRAMKALLKVLGEMEVRSPVSGKLLQKILADTSAIRTEVSIYSGWWPEKRFDVITTRKIPGGNMMRLHGKKEWFILEIPGESVNPASLFVTDPYYWRDLTLFHYLPGEVIRVEVRFGDDANEGFRAGLDTLTGKVFLTPFDTILTRRPVDSGKVRRYLTYFQDLSADAWEPLPHQMQADSILRKKPSYELRVTARGGKEFTMLVFPMYTKDTVTGTGDIDPDIARAWVDPPGEMVRIKYYRIDPFFIPAKNLLLGAGGVSL